LATTPKENIAGQRLAFYIVAGAKDPLAKDISEVKPKMVMTVFACLMARDMVPNMGSVAEAPVASNGSAKN